MKNTEIPFIRNMFDEIAPRYDLLNRLLSARQDVYWRKTMVAAMNIPDNGMVLDVACGTGDVALEICRQKGKNVSVFGVDFSPKMLMLAKQKIIQHTKVNEIHLAAADAFYLPFKCGTFDAITIAFGIRNIIDRLSVLKIFHNILKDGGTLAVLELSMPESRFLVMLYNLYFKRILPLIGWIFSNNLKAYKYLPASVTDFPERHVFAKIMRDAGFRNIRWKNLTMGIATLYIGQKADYLK